MMSFYRKYRPARVEDLDITSVREFFGRVLSSGKFSQAYLFAGPKGTGKTSAARILARVLNCEKNKDSKGKLQEPCGECQSCGAISNGSSSAVTEIDAASNRGIDDIRLLRERVGLVPVTGKYSVFIIDEVHMLTREAFNALLKTLEEPPRHVVFCLCTTEEHKLPDTIVSRCTKVAYTKATSQELVRSLGRVIAGEKLEVSEKTVAAIAKRADGSFRDGVKILDQLASGGEITAERVSWEVGLGRDGAVIRLYELIVGGEGKRALDELARMLAEGVDVAVLAKTLLETARERILERVASEDKVDGRTMEFIEVFSKAFSRFAEVPIESLPVEMAIVELCVDREEASSGVGVEAKKKEKVGSKQGKSDTVRAKPEKENVNKQGKSELEVAAKDEAVEQASEEGAEVEEVKNVELVMSRVQSRWGELLSRVAGFNHGLVMILKGAVVQECKGNRVTLGVAYKFHKDQLEQEKYLQLVEQAASEVFGGRVKLTVVLSPKNRVSDLDEREHENIGVVPAEDAELVAAAEEIFS